MAQTILTTKQQQTHNQENRIVVIKQEREGVEWLGSLGLVDAKYYI